MQSTKDKYQRSTAGFTPVPNAVLFNCDLTHTEFRVYAALLSYAWGKKTTAEATQKEIHCRTGIDRETIGDTFEKLATLGIIKPLNERGRGRKVAYQVRNLPSKDDGPADTLSDKEGASSEASLEKDDGVADISDDGTADTWGVKGDGPTGIKQTKQNQHNSEDASPRLAGSSVSAADVTFAEGIGDGTAQSAASPESTAPSEIEANIEPGSHGNAAEPSATPPGHNGRSKLLHSRDIADEILDEVFGITRSDPEPERQFTKAEVNALFLTPEGERVNDDGYELRYDLVNDVLPLVYGESFNRPEDLDTLIADRGVKLCRLWMHWLPRKIAHRYANGKDVENPTGLYIKAVRGRWQVDPSWPQFDETLHTVAAREEYRKRQEAQRLKHGPKAPVPGTNYTEDDVNRFAEEVRKGERKVIHLIMQLQGPVLRRLDEMALAQVEAKETEATFVNAAKPATDLDFCF